MAAYFNGIKGVVGDAAECRRLLIIYAATTGHGAEIKGSGAKTANEGVRWNRWREGQRQC